MRKRKPRRVYAHNAPKKASGEHVFAEEYCRANAGTEAPNAAQFGPRDWGGLLPMARFIKARRPIARWTCRRLVEAHQRNYGLATTRTLLQHEGNISRLLIEQIEDAATLGDEMN